MIINIGRSNSIVYILARIIGIIIFLFYIGILIIEKYPDINMLTIIVMISVALQVVMLICNRSVYNSGLLMVFYAYTVLVHNGFVIALFFDKNYMSFQSAASMSFVNNPYYEKAIVIANIIIFSFVFFSEISTKQPYYYPKHASTVAEVTNFEGVRWADVVGITILLFGTIYLASLVFSRGLWFVGYINVVDIAEKNALYSHSVILTSLAIALLLSVGTRKGIRFGLILYAINAMLHFSMGNRGEVFYAAVVCFALYSIRFKTIKMKHVIFAVAVVSIIIPIVRVARELRLDSYTLNPLSSFLDVLCEEGLEISPFTYTVQYLENGHGHVFGMTYINYLVDFLFRRIGLTNPLWIEKNMVRAFMPYPGMGYTMVCELYYNFGIFGACIIFGLIGQMIKHIDGKSYYNQLSDGERVFFSMLMVEMINLTRNDCSTLPVYLTYSLILLLVFRITLLNHVRVGLNQPSRVGPNQPISVKSN